MAATNYQGSLTGEEIDALPNKIQEVEDRLKTALSSLQVNEDGCLTIEL